MLNRAVLIGRLTKDPELTIVKGKGKERAIARMTIAYNHRYRKGDQWVDVPHFFDIRAFGRLAQTAGERYGKGDLVFVEGRLSQDRWESKEGQKKSRITIIADSIRLIKAKDDGVTVEDTEEREEEEDEDIRL
jgi:single-strand DNA-binding protein